MTEDTPRWMTIPEGARRAGVPVRTFRTWVMTGAIPVPVVNIAHGIRDVRRIDADAFDEWLHSVKEAG